MPLLPLLQERAEELEEKEGVVKERGHRYLTERDITPGRGAKVTVRSKWSNRSRDRDAHLAASHRLTARRRYQRLPSVS